jgi:hypothetical protein
MGNGQQSGGRECRDAFAYGRRAGPGTSDTHCACPHEEDGVCAHSTSSLFPQFTLCHSGAYPLDRGRCSPRDSRAPSLSAPDSRQESTPGMLLTRRTRPLRPDALLQDASRDELELGTTYIVQSRVNAQRVRDDPPGPLSPGSFPPRESLCGNRNHRMQPHWATMS